MKEKIAKIVSSVILLIAAIILKSQIAWLSTVLFLISYIIVGFEVIKEAFGNIKEGEIFDENFLMTIATVGALIIGEFPEAVAVMIFYNVGEMFEEIATDKSKKSIENLMNIRPDYANLKSDDGKITKVSPDKVKVGDIIVVKPGEKIPLDGIIIEGNSNIDTAALTGESLPSEVQVDSEVLSGCINLTGIITIKVEKEYGESTVCKILDLVQHATTKKAVAENFITKFSKVYTPIVVILALIIAIVPSFILKIGTPYEWIYRALTFLVISCPCALVISVPLSFFGGIGGASKQGILIKGSNYMDYLAKLDTIVFDKTGTLTKGTFIVDKIILADETKYSYPLNKEGKEKCAEILKYAAYAEHYSSHPVATSVKNAYIDEIDESKILDLHEIAGKGVMCKVDGKEVCVGNEKFVNEKVEIKKADNSKTTLYVAVDRKYIGRIAITDEIKEDSKKAIEMLRKEGVSNIVMLTGDKKEAADKVAKEINIDKIYSELLPADKVAKVEELLNNKDDSKALAFVGDGINDSPVLARADIGIAMGGLGSDAAIEAADIVIMTDEPSKVAKAIQVAKKTIKIAHENIAFAIFIKVLILILSAVGIATMWEAVFADVGVTIIAVLNSFRVMKVQ